MKQGLIKSAAIVLSIVMALTLFPLLGGMQAVQSVYAEDNPIVITPTDNYWNVYSDDDYKKYNIQTDTTGYELAVKVGTGFSSWDNWANEFPEDLDLWYFDSFDNEIVIDGSAMYDRLKNAENRTFTMAVALVEEQYAPGEEDPETVVHFLKTQDVTVLEPIARYSYTGSRSDMFPGDNRDITTDTVNCFVQNSNFPEGETYSPRIKKVVTSDATIVKARNHVDYWELIALKAGEVDLTIQVYKNEDGDETADIPLHIKVVNKRVSGRIYNDAERYFAIPGESIDLRATGKYETTSGTRDSSNINYEWSIDKKDTDYAEIIQNPSDPKRATVRFKTPVTLQEDRNIVVWVKMTYTKNGVTGSVYDDWITLKTQYKRLTPDSLDNIHIGQTINVMPELVTCRYNQTTGKPEYYPTTDDVEYSVSTHNTKDMKVTKVNDSTWAVKRVNKNSNWLYIEAQVYDDDGDNYNMPIEINPIRTNLAYYTIEVSDLEDGCYYYLDSPEEVKTPEIKLVDHRYNYVLPKAEYKLTVTKLANKAFPAASSSQNAFRFDYNAENPNALGTGIADYTLAATATSKNAHGFTGSAKPW